MDAFIPISVLGSLGFTLYAITKTLTDYHLRKKMIEKGLVGEDASNILAKEQNIMSKYSSLKWGLIVLSGGIGLVIIDSIVDYRRNPTLPFGILAISISLGFLIYYFIVKNAKRD